MPPRMSGRLRAMSRAQVVSAPERMDVDDEGEDEVDVESEGQVGVDVLPDESSGGEQEADGDEEEEEEEYELEDEEDELRERGDQSSTAGTPLKIKFKVRPPPTRAAFSRPRRARAATRIQSDSDSESEEEMIQNTRLTKRQAALAKSRRAAVASESSQGEDDAENAEAEPNPDPLPVTGRRRRATLDATELALRKEESARKRRNVTERKLQNEKAETINRLLKKQSRPRKNMKAGAAPMPVLLPSTGMVTPASAELQTPIGGPGSDAGYGFEEVVEEITVLPAVEPPPAPVMYRWITTTREQVAENGAATPPAADVSMEESTTGVPAEPRTENDMNTNSMRFVFGVPLSALTELPAPSKTPPPRSPAVCAVDGCEKDRKYRLVGGDWGVGACGMGHLKMLQAGA
ncbi:PAPA-1 domain-containing protein [Mycena kentingensis (nom. inval.)]|nr:PAPA-1 domain-containing protein [Mycena kentingensis (nom. inval.)]